ncbi:hypothetical protein FIM03_04035 [SAR202 cluster bacterium AD-802-L14_MRT_200m]|nr:hypothetical protein [SAR202 cluster bacterium AD-802-L14_MRT_200m]
MQYELTIKGTAAELGQLLSTVESLGLEVSGTDPGMAADKNKRELLADFVSGLSREGKYILDFICSNCPPYGNGVTEESIKDTLEDIRGMWRIGDPGRVELVHVYGVIGGIARRWASTFDNGATNPFKKQQAGARDVYVLNSTFANELRAVIEESGSTMGDLNEQESNTQALR